MQNLDIEEIAKKIDWPLTRWEGNCHGIASQIIEKGIVKGRVVRGHYHGPVEEGSMFFGKPIIPHSWIELEDGTILDPTRWCFEDDYPYIYICKGDSDYDIGGDDWRATMTLSRECPRIKSKVEIFQPFEGECLSYVSSLIYGQTAFSKDQLFWLANLPKDMLFPFTKSIYKGLDKVGMRATVPIDNYRYVMGR